MKKSIIAVIVGIGLTALAQTTNLVEVTAMPDDSPDCAAALGAGLSVGILIFAGCMGAGMWKSALVDDKEQS